MTQDRARRDAAGRLYAAFGAALVQDALAGMRIEIGERPLSAPPERSAGQGSAQAYRAAPGGLNRLIEKPAAPLR